MSVTGEKNQNSDSNGHPCPLAPKNRSFYAKKRCNGHTSPLESQNCWKWPSNGHPCPLAKVSPYYLQASSYSQSVTVTSHHIQLLAPSHHAISSHSVSLTQLPCLVTMSCRTRTSYSHPATMPFHGNQLLASTHHAPHSIQLLEPGSHAISSNQPSVTLFRLSLLSGVYMACIGAAMAASPLSTDSPLSRGEISRCQAVAF